MKWVVRGSLNTSIGVLRRTIAYSKGNNVSESRGHTSIADYKPLRGRYAEITYYKVGYMLNEPGYSRTIGCTFSYHKSADNRSF